MTTRQRKAVGEANSGLGNDEETPPPPATPARPPVAEEPPAPATPARPAPAAAPSGGAEIAHRGEPVPGPQHDIIASMLASKQQADDRPREETRPTDNARRLLHAMVAPPPDPASDRVQLNARVPRMYVEGLNLWRMLSTKRPRPSVQDLVAKLLSGDLTDDERELWHGCVAEAHEALYGYRPEQSPQ